MEELLRNEASAASEARASVELVASISLQTSRRPLAAGNRVGQKPQGGGKPSLSPCPAPCACLCRSSMPQAGGSATRSKGCGPKRQVGRPRAASRHQDVSQGVASRGSWRHRHTCPLHHAPPRLASMGASRWYQYPHVPMCTCIPLWALACGMRMRLCVLPLFV